MTKRKQSPFLDCQLRPPPQGHQGFLHKDLLYFEGLLKKSFADLFTLDSQAMETFEKHCLYIHYTKSEFFFIPTCQ